MGIKLKFNLMLLLIFSIALLLSAYLLQVTLKDNARDEATYRARLMLRSAGSAAEYTVNEIQPLLAPQMQQVFLPQSVSFYAAIKTTHAMAKNLPQYSYRAVALNPTNPRDLAKDWEIEIIRKFQADDTLTEIVTEHDGPTGRMLNLSQPITITNGKCLTCHSDPKIAPQTMLDLYGSGGGFGWNLNETVGAQIVSVPMAVPLQKAHEAFLVFMALMTGIFALLFILINLLLHFTIIRPVRKMAKFANQVSLGKSNVPYYDREGKDEIASLSASFNRMRRSLETALKMLGEDR